MPAKVREAILLGIGVWVAGAWVIVAIGQSPYFATLAIPVAFLTAPAMWLLARWHLRNVPTTERAYAGLRLGAIVTATQCLLDSVGLLVIARLGWPSLSPAAREVLPVALTIGYFWMLTVPWYASRRH